MRVFATIPRYVPTWGGGETAAHGWLAELVRQGDQVVVATSTPSPDGLGGANYHVAGPSDVFVDGVRVLYDRVDYDMADYVAAHRPDFVLTQFEAARRTVAWCAPHEIPVGVLCHGPYGHTELVEAGVDRDVDLWVFNSCFLLDLAGRSLPYVVCSPPIDRARVCAPNKARCRYAATLVNLFENKGPHVLRAVATSNPDRRFLAVLGGYGEQRRMDDVPNVDHWPTCRDVARVYAHSRVVLMPSREESFGMVGIEAQANGIPVIASDIPSMRESLGVGATYCPRDDVAAWSTALRDLDDPDHHAEMCGRALRNVARFDLCADVAWLRSAMHGIARRRPDMVGSAERADRRRVEREMRVREIFIRAADREPTLDELAVHAGGPESVAALEFIIPRLLRVAG